jgi:hypothetical protein
MRNSHPKFIVATYVSENLMIRNSSHRSLAALMLLLSTSLFAQSRATVDKPKSVTVTIGTCRILSDGTFSGNFGPTNLPTLAFSIGPHATMADAMHASKAPFNGPGKYDNVIVALYLGKTALQDSYGGLGSIVLNPDGHTGTFLLNDKTASGSFDCGAVPKPEK